MTAANDHSGLYQRTFRRVIAVALAACALSPTALLGQDATPPEANSDDEHTFEARFAVTAGVGQRDADVPTQAGPRQLDTSMFPTLGLLLSGDYRVHERVSIGLAAQYETSIGLHATDTRGADGADGPSLRSHYGDFGLTAAYRFGSSRRSSSIRLLLGWEIRGLQSAIELSVPSYTLHGAIIRPEFELSLLGGHMIVGLAPELLLVVNVSDDIRSLGATDSGGIGVGGQARVMVKLVRSIDLGVAYRGSYVLIESAYSGDMQDIQHVGLALVGLHY